MNNKVTVSAPGKLLLLGEHSVIYGYPSLVTAMDARVYVKAQKTDENSDRIIAPQVKDTRFVEKALVFFKEKYQLSSSVCVTTRSDFSHNVGLGSSSAVTVASFKALSVLFEKNLTNKEIFNLSYQLTIHIQGVGSGFDIAAAVWGGVLYYIYGGKTIDPVVTSALPLVVGYCGFKADTPTLVKKVRSTYQKSRLATDKIFKEITQLVEKGKKYLMMNDYSHLGNIMTQNHKLLQKLNVSTPKLDRMVEKAVSAGAFGAKLSGAGGGDCMIALVGAVNRKKVEQAIVNAGGEIIQVQNNAPGVRVEQ